MIFKSRKERGVESCIYTLFRDTRKFDFKALTDPHNNPPGKN